MQYNGTSCGCFPRKSRDGMGSPQTSSWAGEAVYCWRPKQSIYRFRNADIETYLEIVDSRRLDTLGLSRLELTTNYRSVPSILRFVDAVFENTMNPTGEGSRYQPRYLAFGERGDRKPEVHIRPPSPCLRMRKVKTMRSGRQRSLCGIESGESPGLFWR